MDVTTKALNTGINFVANIKLNNTGRAIQVFWSHFDLSVENGLRSHWFCFTAHSDWCRKVALTCFSTNQMCFPALEVPLPASSDWPIRLITLVSLYDVQPKSVLVFMIKSSNPNSIKVSHFFALLENASRCKKYIFVEFSSPFHRNKAYEFSHSLLRKK